MAEIENKSIETLKKMVIEESDLSEVINYFFDLTDENVISFTTEFLTKKQIKKSNEIQSVISAIEKMLSNFFKYKVKLNQPILTYISQEKLYHGLCSIKGKTWTIPIAYFSDVKIGIFCFGELGGTSEFFRFSLAEAQYLKSRH